MKKLFFSFLLGTIIAICWVMIIHTLKWIAIRGNEFELLNAQQQSNNNINNNINNINNNNNLNIIATNAVDVNLHELNHNQNNNNNNNDLNNHNNDNNNYNGPSSHLGRQLSPAQHQALQVRALPSLDSQDLASGLPAPVPLRSSGPAAPVASSFVHKRSLHDTDQANQVYQEAQFDKRKGRRREAGRRESAALKDNANNNNNGRDNNDAIVSNSSGGPLPLTPASVGDQAEIKVPIALLTASAKTTTTTATTRATCTKIVPSVRDEINNGRSNIPGSGSRLGRRQANAADIGDQLPVDEDSSPSQIVGGYSQTPLRLRGQSSPLDDNEDSDSDARRLVVASSIQQQPQGQGRRYQQHQQQNNRTARPAGRSGQRNSDRHPIGSAGQDGGGPKSTPAGKRLKRPQYDSNQLRPMATPNESGAASDLDLVSLPSELNSTASSSTRPSDRSRDEDDNGDENSDSDAGAGDASSGAMGHAKTDNSVDEPLLIDGLAGPVGAGDAMLTVGAVPPASSLERSSEPTIAGLFYRAPFFTSWFVSTWNILFMPVFTLISSCCFRNEDSTTKKLLVESISQFMDNGLTTLQFLGRCAFFSVLWIGTIFGIVYSLAHLDATVVMALFACSAALVYLLSWVLLHQQFVGVRIVAVIICTTGIALLAYMDNSRTLGSVLIVAGSALCSAVYKVIYQRMFGFWSIAQMSLFFTLIGLFNAFLMWPIALLLYFLGVELIVWRYIPWMHLTAAGALHLTANIVAYFGPICSYDIFLTLGLLFAVVLSADVTFYKITFFGMKLAGVLLLMIGFLVCLLPENWNEYLYDLVNERFIRWKKQRSLKKSRNKVQDMSTGQMSRLRTPSGRVK